MRHLSYFYKRGLLVVLLLNWLTVLVVGVWQGGVHQVGPASCEPRHQEYFLCGANTAVAKESILSSRQRLTFLLTVGICAVVR